MPEVPEGSRIRIFGSIVELYQLDNGDFERILKAGRSTSKDIFLCSLPITVPLLVNAFGELGKTPQTQTSLSTLSTILSSGLSSLLFLNSAFGLIGGIVAFISGIVWCVTYESLPKVINTIKAEKKQIN